MTSVKYSNLLIQLVKVQSESTKLQPQRKSINNCALLYAPIIASNKLVTKPTILIHYNK